MNEQTRPPLFLTLAGLVNQEMSSRVFQTLTGGIRDGFENVHLLVQSTGGFIGDGIAIYNFLSSLPITLTTYNVGHVASIAVPIFLSGANRMCSETATFMIHRPASTNIGGPSNAVAAIAHSLDIDEERCKTILKSKITLTPKQWAAYANNDLTFSAKEALKAGFVHRHGLFAPIKNAPLFNI